MREVVQPPADEDDEDDTEPEPEKTEEDIRLEFLKGTPAQFDKRGKPVNEECLVYPGNWWPARVFDMCEWIMHIGMTKWPIYQGIKGQEIEAVTRMLKAPEDEYENILIAIKDSMVPAALVHLNRKREG